MATTWLGECSAEEWLELAGIGSWMSPAVFQNPVVTTTIAITWNLPRLKCRTFAGVGKNRPLDQPSRFQEARDDHHNGIDPGAAEKKDFAAG